MKKRFILFEILFLLLFQKISLPQDLTPEQIYEKVNDCVVVIQSYNFEGKFSKQGSGVVISDKGWVVTNYHVFAECEKMEVKHNDKIIKYTDIVGVDIEKDILILKIEDYTFPSIPLGSSDNLKVGQRIYTIGSPLGLENSMSEGIISGLRNVDEKNRNYIQTTASISPGSSGGAVINNRGELIGISTMTLKGGQNINFAIPIKDILSITLGSFSDRKSIDANNYFYMGYNATNNGNYKEAINYYTKFLEELPNNTSAYNNRGIVYGKLHEYFKAILDFNRAIEINPNYERAYCNRGFAYIQLKEYSKAILDFNKAIELNPDDADAYFNRAIAYNALQDYSKTISDYNQAIELNPNYSDAYYNRGNIYYKLQNYSRAISDYSYAIILNPKDAGFYYNRGLAYYFSENMNKACEDWSKAYSLGVEQAKELLNEYCK